MHTQSDIRIDPVREAVYAPEVKSKIWRLLGQQDRERTSPSYGSFDRDHWSWKFRDFPITMMQFAHTTLAMLWCLPLSGNPCYREPRVLEWIEASLRNTLSRQHSDGAFDSVGPFTRDYGVSLAMVFGFTETSRILGDALSERARADVNEAVQRACEFSLRSHEDYAFISNHQALFALAYLNAADVTGLGRYREQAGEIVSAILDHQSPDGWYSEYDGPDPGYESLGISYLATYHQRAGGSDLFQSLIRSVEFFAHCIHPDGSLGGVYGSRHTSLYYPSGFELLAGRMETAAAVVRFMRPRLAEGNVVTPRGSDFENLPSLCYSYLNACTHEEPVLDSEGARLPCESLHATKWYPDAGIAVSGARRYYAVFNFAKGGVCRVFDRRTANLAYQDAGYIVRAANRSWVSQIIGTTKPSREGQDRFACAGRLAEHRAQALTPIKFLILRALNLTLFRSLTLAEWCRNKIVSRLITARRSGPFTYGRTVTLQEDSISIADTLGSERKGSVAGIELARDSMAIHMGSAKYFHRSELLPIPSPPLTGVSRDLNERGAARVSFELWFPDDAAMEIRTAADSRGVEDFSREEALTQS